MILNTLDQIIRRTLLENGYPIHYYAEYLFHASTCLRELTIDTLQIVNTADLALNSYNAAKLPIGYQDYVSVTIPIGGVLRPIAEKKSLNPLRQRDSNGNFVAYTGFDDLTSPSQTIYGISSQWVWYWNFNSYGEPTGGYYGANGSDNRNGFEIFKQRREIQLTQQFGSPNIIMIYISDGQNVDAASQIDAAAFTTIQAFINWKRSPNANNDYSPEARTFYNRKTMLKARLSDATLPNIREVLYRNYTASIKN